MTRISHRGKGRRARVVVVAAILGMSVLSFAGTAVGKPPAPRPGKPGAAGISGVSATMQPVNVAAKVARTAVVPGSSGSEAWAMGEVTGYQDGWARGGQLVFLHYQTATGWEIDGPPVNAKGKVVNPVLANLTLASNGEGWAVGQHGSIVHHAPGGKWVLGESICQSGTCPNLVGISVVTVGDKVQGYAVGAQSTVLKLGEDGKWTADPLPIPGANPIDLASVAAVDADNAWAVSDGSSASLQIFQRTAAGWTRQMTGNALFDDAPASNNNGQVNFSAAGWAVAAAPANRVWFAGGIRPFDPGNPSGDKNVGDDTRPFTIRFDPQVVDPRTNTHFTTFCPDTYSLKNQLVQVNGVCS